MTKNQACAVDFPPQYHMGCTAGRCGNLCARGSGEKAMRLFRGILSTFLAWAALAGAVQAQNGLERFEREVKPQIEVEKFTYASAQPLGDHGFVLNDVVVVMPANPATGDKASTIKFDKVTVFEADFDRLKSKDSEDLPRFAKMKIEGMMGDDESFASLAPYGIPKVPVDVTIDYRLDPAAKIFTLNALEVSLRGQGRFTLGLVMDGISEKTSDVSAAQNDGRLRSASLMVEDQGLIAKLLPPVAKEQGTTADGLVTLALTSLAAFTSGQGPETLRMLDAIASFVGDWKAPKGALVVGLKPAQTTGFADIMRAMEPNALVTVFGLSATYPGTRPGAAKAGAAK